MIDHGSSNQSPDLGLPSHIRVKRIEESNNRRERLGGGGEALVYTGIMEDGDGVLIEVAIKECTNPLNQRSLEAFKNEQKVLKIIPTTAHHLVRGIVYGETFSVLEKHGDGTTLEEYARSGSLTAREVMNILKQVAYGLDELYLLTIDGQPIRYHGDLKLKNCLIDPETSEVRIGDFSLVNRLTHQSGTLDFMSPEVITPYPDLDRLDWRVDLFALAIMAYRLFTRKHPVIDQQTWENVEIDKIKKQIVKANTKLLILLPQQQNLNKRERDEQLMLRARAEQLENVLQSCFVKALASKPQNRYTKSHWDFINDLDRVISQIERMYTITSFEDFSD